MAKKTGGLGRGFYDIFNDNVLEGKKGSGEPIRISDIEPRRDQPRKTFEREALEVLADSIATYGVLQPIIVRESLQAEGTYEIIAGERRWRAAKMAGLSEIPAIVFDGDDMKAAEVSLIENIQREDLNPVEEAAGYGALIEKFGLTQDQVAKKVGKSRSAVANMLRLLDLPDEALEMLRIGEITAGHARALISVPQVDQVKIAETAVKEGISVRDVEKRVKEYFMPPEEKKKQKIKMELSLELKELIGDMQRVLGTKVNAIGNDKKGRIYIDYYTRDDLDRLSEIIDYVKTTKK